MFVKTVTAPCEILEELQRNGNQQGYNCLQCYIHLVHPLSLLHLVQNWKDLMVVLASCSGRNISNEQVDKLSDEEHS